MTLKNALLGIFKGGESICSEISQEQYTNVLGLSIHIRLEGNRVPARSLIIENYRQRRLKNG